MAKQKTATAAATAAVCAALAVGALGGFLGHAAMVKPPPAAPPPVFTPGTGEVTHAPTPVEPVCPQVDRALPPRRTMLADVARDWGITGRLDCSVVDIP